MKTITPTVGRIVYFNPNGGANRPDLAAPTDSEPLAAIVAAVLGSGQLLNLSVIDSTGRHHPFAGVPLVQEGEEPPKLMPYAYWMPDTLHAAGIKPLEDKPVAPFAGIDKATLATAAALPANPAPGAAPKVEEARINALMASLDYRTAHLEGTTSTVATARLPGGFVVAIGHSATVNAGNFDAEKGRTYAIQSAERKARAALWEMEGYALFLRMEQLRAAGIDETMPAHQQRVMLERLELDERIVKLDAFIKTSGREGSIFDQLPVEEQVDLYNQLEAMMLTSKILTNRIGRFPKVQA